MSFPFVRRSFELACRRAPRHAVRRAPCRCHASSSSRSSYPPQASQRSLLLPGSLGFLLLAGGATWYWSTSNPASPPQLSYSSFTPLPIHSIERITDDSSIISLTVPPHLLPDPGAYPEPADTPLQAIYVRQPELQIQRAYTPLALDCFSPSSPNSAGTQGNQVRLLVKRYHDGEVSSFLHRLRQGEEVYVRGPVRTWTLPPCDELIFIAGGTGLTPLVQLLTSCHSLPNRIKLLYSSSTPDTSLLSSILPKDASLETRQVFGRLSDKDLASFVGNPSPTQRTQVVVCGPEGFVATVAGKRSLNAQNDPVGGMLARLAWTEANVKKL